MSSTPDDPARVPARGPGATSDTTDTTDTAVRPASGAGPLDVPPPPPPPGTAVAPPPPSAPVPPPPEPLPPDDTTSAADGDPPVDEGVVWADRPAADDPAAADAAPAADVTPDADGVPPADRDADVTPDADRDADGVPLADRDADVGPLADGVSDDRGADVTPVADGDTAGTAPSAPYDAEADEPPPPPGDRADDPADADSVGLAAGPADEGSPDAVPAGLHRLPATDADAGTDDPDDPDGVGPPPAADRDDAVPRPDEGAQVTTGVAGAFPALAVEDRYDDLSDDRDPEPAAADDDADAGGDLDDGGSEGDLIGAAAAGGPPAHDPAIGAPLVRGGDAFTGRWDDIQIDFVDDPRAAVERADGLVGDVVDEILRALATERERLAGPWRDDQSATTEDLRQAFQRYRGVFQRLLRT